jgi:type I restriction-modification system DNA methylase subunit
MRLTQQQLEAHLFGAANILRGKTAGQDYKNYILSLMFYKRLCDQWENEADEAIAELERQQGHTFTEPQKAIFRSREEHRFSIPAGARWGDVLAVAEDIGKKLTEAMQAISSTNEELRGVFTVDWNQPAPDASGKRLIPNEVVHALVQHLIRQALLESRVMDAVISLPLNVFYGAGVPACLLILRKDRPVARRDQVLLVYAARHYREHSNQNELRPQDVMRILVHYHAYGDAARVPGRQTHYQPGFHEQDPGEGFSLSRSFTVRAAGDCRYRRRSKGKNPRAGAERGGFSTT